jgi:hypothetical protein
MTFCETATYDSETGIVTFAPCEIDWGASMSIEPIAASTEPVAANERSEVGATPAVDLIATQTLEAPAAEEVAVLAYTGAQTELLAAGGLGLVLVGVALVGLQWARRKWRECEVEEREARVARQACERAWANRFRS